MSKCWVNVRCVLCLKNKNLSPDIPNDFYVDVNAMIFLPEIITCPVTISSVQKRKYISGDMGTIHQSALFGMIMENQAYFLLSALVHSGCTCHRNASLCQDKQILFEELQHSFCCCTKLGGKGTYML